MLSASGAAVRPETITAVAALVAAVTTGFAVVLTALRNGRKIEEVREANEKSDEKLSEIHVLVNARLDEALARILMFEKRLGLEPGAEPDDELTEEAP